MTQQEMEEGFIAGTTALNRLPLTSEESSTVPIIHLFYLKAFSTVEVS
jgi:hypothetical protein